jgi:hypothetical protein
MAAECWEDQRVVRDVDPRLGSQATAAGDVVQDDAHRLSVDRDGPLVVGLGVLDVQTAELLGRLTDCLCRC